MACSRLSRDCTSNVAKIVFHQLVFQLLDGHREVEKQVGEKLSLLRWRCNLWIDGCKPWDENKWIGKNLKIGDATFKIEEKIVRCRATTANPKSGLRDVDTLAALDSLGQEDFTVAATATSIGQIKYGDPVEVLS